MRAATRTTAIAAIVIAGAAACGSSSSGGTATRPAKRSAGTSGAATSAAVVMTHSGSGGTYLTDGKGMTLYLFEADKTSASTCSSACASYWPPYTTTGAPTASGKAQQSKIGTS